MTYLTAPASLKIMLGLDLSEFSAACGELYAPGLDAESFAPRSFAFLRTLVSAEFSGCGTFDHRAQTLRIGFDTEHPSFLPAMEAFSVLMKNYELYNFSASVNGGRPFRRSQFFSDREFKNLDIYSEVYAPLGVDNHCALHVPSRQGETLFYFLERSGGPDFSDEELALLREAQTHLSNAFQFCHAPANETGAPIDVTAFTQVGLTPREADVLTWLTYGKSNAEIACVLNLRLPTVKGYVASIFNKLGVDNRLAATLRARQLCEAHRRRDASPARFLRLAVS